MYETLKPSSDLLSQINTGSWNKNVSFFIKIYNKKVPSVLSKLEIPSSVLVIEYGIVADCNINILVINRSISVDSTITQINTSLGRIDRSNFTIYIPDDSIEEYKSADFWKYYVDYMVNLSEYVED